MKIHCVVKSGQAPDYHRIVVPMLNMKLGPGDQCNMTFTGEETDELWDCDILMFNRDIATTVPELVALREKHGFKIVLDVDDYWEVPYGHILWPSWQETDRANLLVAYIKIADLVIVSTDTLATQVKCYNPNTVVIPNCLEVQPINHTESDKTRFIYTGGTTHAPDLKLIEGKIRRIGDDGSIRDRARFSSVFFHDLFRLTRCFDPIKQLPLDEYMSQYNNADVAIIPLQDNLFNSCKSELKIIEAGMMGVPCIVSAVKPYTNLKHYPGILWVEHPREWLEHVRYCLGNKSLRNAGQMLRECILRDFNLDHWNEVRYNTLKSL